MVVKKSEGYSVEQLERLYALLSQCIYQHRREYDKAQLLEVRHVHSTRQAFLCVYSVSCPVVREAKIKKN